MRKHYLLSLLLAILIAIAVISCNKDDNSDYTEIPLSPVVLDLNAAPYPKLSDYNFFEGDLKNLQPVYGVLPYDLNSSLFTDYALKKRFVWMPQGVKASYVSDGDILNFPTGTVLIKNFYYENVQPDNETIIIETRLMIKKAGGWIFANYVWNDEQTEAFLNTTEITKEITIEGNRAVSNINYKIPSTENCSACHLQNNIPLPIGPKPQNLNKIFDYNGTLTNQLVKWKEFEYLETNTPVDIVSTVNWKDETQPLDLRARSYLDINCAHCHTQGGQCDYTPLDLAFNKTSHPENLGVCIEPSDFSGDITYLISGGNYTNSLIYYRMESNIPSEMMPFIGRTVPDLDALILMRTWINSLETCP